MNQAVRAVVFSSIVALGVTGCSTFRSAPTEKTLSSPTPAVTRDQQVAAAGKGEAPPTINVPSWFIKPPGASENYVWITGTGFSNDLAMSRKKAMLDSQIQLADKINGVVSAMVKQSLRDDAGSATIERTSSFAKKVIMETSITGHLLEDSRVVPENRGYRTFVLVRYPLGESNRILKEKLNLDRRDTQKYEVDEDELEKEIQNRRGPTTGSAAPSNQPAARPSAAAFPPGTVDRTPPQADSVPAPRREPGPGENRFVEEPIAPQVLNADPLQKYRQQ